MRKRKSRKRRMEQLVEKWEPLVGDLDSDRDKANCAAVLENQEDYFDGQLMSEDELKEAKELTEAGTASVAADPSLTGIARFKKIIIPMVRRTFPTLIANDILGVQPMDSPVGLAYALRYTYQSGDEAGDEAGHNTIHSDYSGPYDTETAERKDAPRFEGGSSGEMNEMGMRVEKQTIEAQDRMLKARWSLQSEQDLNAMHGLNVEDEVTDVLSYEINAHINREIIGYLQEIAKYGGTYSWDIGETNDADGRWEQEKFSTFYTKLLGAANEIALATRRGPGNFLIASPNVVAMLQSLGASSSPVRGAVDVNIDTDLTGSAHVGRVGQFDLYRDMFADDDYCVVGYKGPRDDDAGLIYCPYVPVMFSRGVGEENFQPRLGVMTRYALADSLWGAENYYRYVDVELNDTIGTFSSDDTASADVPYTVNSEPPVSGE